MTPTQPLVSVCICAYNAASYIDAALTSVAGQAYGHLEIIVVDDGSTDGTAAVVGQWAGRDPRVRLLRLLENRGVAHARQAALEAATGDWLVFLDADDVAFSDLVERQMSVVREDPSVMVVGVAAILTGPAGPSHPVGIRRLGPSNTTHFKLLIGKNKLVFMETPSLVLRKVAIEAGGFRLFSSQRDGTVRMRDLAEDLDLWCRISDFGRRGLVMKALSEPLVYIRKTAGSLSSANAELMAMKIAWIKDCLRRRRDGIPEMPYDDFERSLRGLQWLRFRRVAFGAQQWRALTAAYMERNWGETLARLLVVLVVDPGRLLRGLQRLQRTATLEKP